MYFYEIYVYFHMYIVFTYYNIFICFSDLQFNFFTQARELWAAVVVAVAAPAAVISTI